MLRNTLIDLQLPLQCEQPAVKGLLVFSRPGDSIAVVEKTAWSPELVARVQAFLCVLPGSSNGLAIEFVILVVLKLRTVS